MLDRIFFFFFKIIYTIITCLITILVLLGPFLNNWDTSLSGIVLTYFLFVFGLFNVAGFVNIFFTGRRFDSQFKNVLVNDENIDSKRLSFFVSFRTLVRLPSIRTLFYSSCIVFPNWTRNERAYHSWFNGYDFRINSTLCCILLSYTVMVLMILIYVLLALLLALSIF